MGTLVMSKMYTSNLRDEGITQRQEVLYFSNQAYPMIAILKSFVNMRTNQSLNVVA